MVALDRYRQGVIEPGDHISRLAKAVNVASYTNNQAVLVVDSDHDSDRGSFRGAVGFTWAPHILREMRAPDLLTDKWPMTMAVENDGAGGKPMFFGLAGTKAAFAQLGWEVIAMTADDLARTGRFPAVLANEVCFRRVTKENLPLIEAMLGGFGRALKRARLVSITGETAVMGHQITSLFDSDSPKQVAMTWGGTCIGLCSGDLYFDGSSIEPGMCVVGFWEPGYRCNGGTFLANVIKAKWGTDPSVIRKDPEARAFIKGLVVPSLSYARTLTRLAGWCHDGSVGKPLADIRGAAHITGGGLWGKFGELLPKGVGAQLMNMPAPAAVLLDAQRLSRGTEFEMSDREAYSTFHGGCGMLVVVPAQDADVVIREAQRDRVRASVVGKISASADREILVRSRFLRSPGKILSSLASPS